MTNTKYFIQSLLINKGFGRASMRFVLKNLYHMEFDYSLHFTVGNGTNCIPNVYIKTLEKIPDTATMLT